MAASLEPPPIHPLSLRPFGLVPHPADQHSIDWRQVEGPNVATLAAWRRGPAPISRPSNVVPAPAGRLPLALLSGSPEVVDWPARFRRSSVANLRPALGRAASTTA